MEGEEKIKGIIGRVFCDERIVENMETCMEIVKDEYQKTQSILTEEWNSKIQPVFVMVEV